MINANQARLLTDEFHDDEVELIMDRLEEQVKDVALNQGKNNYTLEFNKDEEIYLVKVTEILSDLEYTIIEVTGNTIEFKWGTDYESR